MRKRRTKRSTKRSTTRSTKRSTKQSGGGIDFKKLKLVLNNRSRASTLAAISAKKAQELKDRFT